MDDGQCRHIHAVETVRVNADGTAEWVVGTNLDLTDLKQAEQALQRANEELEARVWERTRELGEVNVALTEEIAERKRVEQALRENRRQLATAFAEQEALSRDLHDSVVQSLFAIGMSLDECRALLDEDLSAARERLLAETRNLRHVIQEVRQVLVEPAAATIDADEFLTELQELARQATDRDLCRICVEVDRSSVARLTNEQATNLLYIVREAVSNAINHARPRAVKLPSRYPTMSSRSPSKTTDPASIHQQHARPAMACGISRIGRSSLEQISLFDRTQERAPRWPSHCYWRLPMKDRRTGPILVVIVDDHEMVRLGLKTTLGRSSSIRVMGEAASIAEAWTQLDQQRPDVVLLDVRLPDGNGVVACRDIRARFPDTHVLFLTSYSDQDAAIGAVFGGAAGYFMKDISSQALIEAIQKVAEGQIVLDPSVTQDVLARLRGMAQWPAEPGSVTPSLSVQEEKVLALIAEGLSNKEIAVQLDLSEKTVTNYVYRLYKKIQVKRRSQAARYFLQYKVS